MLCKPASKALTCTHVRKYTMWGTSPQGSSCKEGKNANFGICALPHIYKQTGKKIHKRWLNTLLILNYLKQQNQREQILKAFRE